MAAIMLKDVPRDIHKWLKDEAQRNRRSMSQQLLYILEQTRTRTLPPVPLPRALKTRRPFTNEWLLKAMKEGRA